MADPTPAPDPAALATALQDITLAIGNLGKLLGVTGATLRTTKKDLSDLTDVLADLSPEAQRAVQIAAASLRSTLDQSKALRQLQDALAAGKVSSDERVKALDRFDVALRRVSADFDISNMGMREFGQRIKSGTLDYGEFTNQVLNSVGRFKYGWLSVMLEGAKGLERMDIQVRRATVGTLGIGEGRVRGAAGLGVREYQANEELRAQSAKTIMSLMLMGRTSEQAAGDMMAMTQIFGGSMGRAGEVISMSVAQVSAAFSKAANVSEQTSRSATINLVQRFGMSAQQAATTLVGFDREAHKLGMGTELYTGWVTELSQVTRAYTSDTSFAQAVVRRFANELKEGQITIQQFSQMATSLRQADFGRQAGIIALANQMGVRVPGLPRGANPLAAIGLVGERDKQTALLGVQVDVMRKLAGQIAGPGATDLEMMGAMRLAAQEFPALRGLQSLSNDTLKNILAGTKDLAKIQKEVGTPPKDPAQQMSELIGHAQAISLSTQTLAEAIQTTIYANAFRVFTVRMGGGEEQTERLRQQRAFQERERQQLQQLQTRAKAGDPEAIRQLEERRISMEAQKQRQAREEKQFIAGGMAPTEAHRLAGLARLARTGDPEAKQQAEDMMAAERRRRTVQAGVQAGAHVAGEVGQFMSLAFPFLRVRSREEEHKEDRRAREAKQEKPDERKPGAPPPPPPGAQPVVLRPTGLPATPQQRQRAAIVSEPRVLVGAARALEARPERQIGGREFVTPRLAPQPPTSVLTREAAPAREAALVQAPRPTMQAAPAPQGGQQPKQSTAQASNVNVDVKVGLTGDDKEGLIQRVIQEVEKALRWTDIH